MVSPRDEMMPWQIMAVRCQSSVRIGRWNQMAWSRLATCMNFCHTDTPCGSIEVVSRPKSEA